MPPAISRLMPASSVNSTPVVAPLADGLPPVTGKPPGVAVWARAVAVGFGVGVGESVGAGVSVGSGVSVGAGV